MIVWVAGWPHCGSTLIREFIQETFGHNSFSKYLEKKLAFRFGPESVEFSKHWSPKHYMECRQSKKLFLIKTHEAPVDDSPAIYVQRDGRDAVVSLSHFWPDHTLHDLITAQYIRFMDWSTMYRAWHPQDRPNTLYLKFDEIINEPEETAFQIETAFEWDRIGEFTDTTFADGKENFPRLYNDRFNVWQKELVGANLELFNRLHGDVMKECGYAD